MNKFSVWIMALTLVSCFGLPVMGEEVENKKNYVPPGTTEYEFEDELLRGDIRGPAGSTIHVPIRVQSRSLIKIRRQFVPEMLKTVETI